MDLKEIFDGMDQGPKNINDNFNNISKGFDILAEKFSNKGSDFKVTDWMKDGIVFESGFVDFTGSPSGYRYMQFPNGAKIVELSLHSKLTQGISGYGGGGWVKLPDLIAPNSYQLTGQVSGKYFCGQSSTNELTISKVDGGNWDQNDYSYSYHTMYFM